MHHLLLELRRKIKSPEHICEESIRLLNEYEEEIVAEHSRRVANEAERLAVAFGEDSEAARVAGILHDISAIIPDDIKLEISEDLNIDILDEEREIPFIIHQKLSKEIARIVFGITDEQILSAISCHTTLKANPTKLDMILFIADKLEWDQKEIPPYYNMIQEGLKESLECGTFRFIDYLYQDKSNLKVVHPWLVDAYNYFTKNKGYKPNVT